MLHRTIEQENLDARAERKKNKDRLLKIPRPQEEKRELPLELKLLLKPQRNPLEDESLDYNAPLPAVEFQKQLTQQRQNQNQQQQQLQHQVHAAYERHIKITEQKIEYKLHPGYRNIISIQPTVHYGMSDYAADNELARLFGADYKKILTSLAGSHESRYNSIGYISLDAAKYILKHREQFQSGLVLENLPDGFYLAVTEGNRVVDPYGGAVGEYPRTVLCYDPKLINNKKSSLTPQLRKAPSPCKIKGSPAQFNVEGSKEFFTNFKHYSPKLYTVDSSKTLLFNDIKNQNYYFDKSNGVDPLHANEILKRMGCYINYLFNYDAYSTGKVTKKPGNQPRIKGITLDDLEENLKQIRQEITERHQTQRENLFLLLRGESKDCENKKIAENIIEEYEQLFEFFDGNDIAGLFDIFYTYGCEGVEIFLKKLKKIFDCDDYAETFFHFKTTFLHSSANWCEFLEDDSLENLDFIAELNPTERLWWNKLIASHIEYCGDSDLNALCGAFKHFLKEYRKIGKEKLGSDKVILLPEIYSLGTVKNMFVVLERVLMVLSYTRNFQEQLELFSLIKWNSPDIEFVLRYRNGEGVPQPYRLIAHEMKINEFKTPFYEDIFFRDKKDVHPVLTYDELVDMSRYERYGYVQSIVPYAYKYLGPVEYSAPFASYMAAFREIASQNYCPQLSSIVAINKLILLITISTTHERGHKCDIQNELQRLKVSLVDGYAWANEVFSVCYGLFARAKWLNFSEIVTVARIFFEVTLESRQFLANLVVSYKQEFLKHLEFYDNNPDRISSNNYVRALRLIADEYKEDEQLQAKLPRILSIINRKNFTTDELKELIELLNKFKKNFGAYPFEQVLDILSILQVEPNRDRPTINDFIDTAKQLLKLEGSSLTQHIIKCLPANCFYDPADCRARVMPPLDDKAIMNGLKEEALANGVELDEKEIEAQGFNYIVLKCNTPDGIPVAKKWIGMFQKNQVRKHRSQVKFEVSDDKKDEKQSDAAKKYERQLETITETIFYPDLSAYEVSKTLTPMKRYAEQVEIFIKLLMKIQAQWPSALPEILQQLCGTQSKTTSSRSIFYLNDFLQQIVNLHPKGSPFPMDFFNKLLDYELKQKDGIDIKLMALGDILKAEKLSRNHKMKLLDLNLSSALMKVDSVGFIHHLIEYYDQFSNVFSTLLDIISKQSEDRETVFKNTLEFLKMLSDIGNVKLIEKFFTLMDKNPAAYPKIIGVIASVAKQSSMVELKATKEKRGSKEPTQASEVKRPDSPLKPKDLNKRQIITKLVFQACKAKDFDEALVLQLIDFLAENDIETLKKLSNMMPPPNFKTLIAILAEGECEPFLANPTNPKYGYRNLSEQFDTSRLFSAVLESKILTPGKTLSYSRRRKLLKQLMLVNKYGHDPKFPIYLRHKKVGITAHELSLSEIQSLVIKCRKIYKESTDEKARENALLIFVTLVREAMWRATGKFPYTTQIIPLLIAMLNKEHQFEEIDTGEGKGMMMAMLSALLWFEGDTVNVTTSNYELAKVAFKEFAPLFDILGIPRAQSIITAQSSVSKDYCYGGINYSYKPDFPIFIAKQKIDPYFIQNHTKRSYSLAKDEADDDTFGDKVHYRVAELLHSVDVTWCFKVIFHFTRSPEFKDPNITIGQALTKIRALLIAEAKKLGKDSEYIEKKLTDKQLFTWLQATRFAPSILLNKEIVIRVETQGTGSDEEKVSFARPLCDERVSEGSELSNGLQQALHTYFNQVLIVEKQQQIPPFPVTDPTVPVASISIKDVIEHHIRSGGRMIGMTGTAGSKAELEELYKKFGIIVYRIPPHRQNQREHDTPILARDESHQFADIVNSLVRHIRQDESIGWFGWEPDPFPQPCSVHIKDIAASERLYNHLLSQQSRFKGYEGKLNIILRNANKTVLNGKEVDLSEEEVISLAGVAGSILVTTNLDRGADFKPRKKRDDTEQNHSKGMFVIEASLLSERDSRQVQGRAARLGHRGQTQFIVNQKEFARRDVAEVRRERAETDKTERLLADRLSTIKNSFFHKFIEIIAQDEKALSPELRLAWANCLNNIDIEWQKAVAKYRSQHLKKDEASPKQTKDEIEQIILNKCTDDVVRSACKDWNNFPSPRPLLAPTSIIKEVTEAKVSSALPEAEEPDAGFDLHSKDVSVTKEYIDNCPLLITASDEEVKFVKERIEANRAEATLQCLAQLLDQPSINLYDGSLRHVLMKLISDRFDDKPIQLRKLFVECFSIIEWSKDKKLHADFSREFHMAFYLFAQAKLKELQITSINLKIKKDRSQTNEVNELRAMLDFISEAVDAKEKERKQWGLIGAYFTGVSNCCDVLGKLKDFIFEHAFLKDEELSKALKDAEKSLVYANSWCVSFNPKAQVEAQKSASLESKRSGKESKLKLESAPEADDGFVFV